MIGGAIINGDLIRTLFEWLKELAPCQQVQQWEAGVRFTNGRFKKVVGPGVYWIVPWFMYVETVNIVESILGTGRQDITLRDGTTLSFVATARVRVVDPRAAVCDVDDYRETTQELLASVLAQELADADPARFDPARGKRDRLLNELTANVAAEAKKYGVLVEDIRFTSFVRNIRTYRLLNDTNTIANW